MVGHVLRVESADGDVGDHLELGQGIKDALIDRVVQHRDETLRSLRGSDQLVLRERSILSIEPQVRTRPNDILSVDGERARQIQCRFHDPLFSG